MGKVIAVANQKGGVGKTTTCVNLCASLVALDRRVLLIDLDPQGNTTMGSGIDKSQLELSMMDVLLDETDINKVRQSTQAGYDLLPANSDLTAAEIGLMDVKRREHRLLKALLRARENYDFIFIDCPPSLNMLTLNALAASNAVLIPAQCEYYALEGLSGLMQTVEQIRSTINPKLHIEGVVRTMYDGRSRLTTEVSAQLKEHFADRLFDTVIPRNIRLAEAPSYGLPALLYDKGSAGAVAYLKLAQEILDRRANEFESSAEMAAAV